MKKIESLDDIFSSFFAIIIGKEGVRIVSSPLLAVMRGLYVQKPTSDTYSFNLDDKSTSAAINELKDHLHRYSAKCFTDFNTPLTYLLDELICNIQQHSQAKCGYGFLKYNPDSNVIEIVVADMGICIYGSYVVAQKYLDKFGNSDAEALNLAQNGYSVKNLPDAENRGYGLSSSISMVVDGLQGEFAVLSGNALLIQSTKQKKILVLPKEIDYKGTMVMVRIPNKLPEGFNLYKYTS